MGTVATYEGGGGLQCTHIGAESGRAWTLDRSRDRLGHELEEGDDGATDTRAQVISDRREGRGRGRLRWLRLALLGRTRKQGERGGPRAGEGRLGQQAEKRRGKRKFLYLFIL